jgi:anti-sigma factor ChrR (cupin superfamily)
MSTLRLDGVFSRVADELAWEPVHPGIRKRQLMGAAGQRQYLLLEIAAGATWPELDEHADGPEDVFVLSGVLGDGERTYEAGTFIHNPKGSAHVPQSKTGCVLLVAYPEG